ncbi:hypothetical protein QBC43DRAFT_293067 [Cladorrhinum sp. PSN259]|nr:hypothetical protein QBC43DRAFT_293067 [Cladorrhinum sp. PSN259]
MAVYIMLNMRKVKKVLLDEQAERRRVAAVGAVDTYDPFSNDSTTNLQSQFAGRRSYQILSKEL